MKQHIKLGWAGGALLLLALAGTTVASNMGFKCVPNLATADPDVYDVSIPLLNDYTDLASIYDDISASCAGGAAQVTKFNPDQSACSWTGPFSCNAPLGAGECVRVSAAAPCTSWVIVGSHDPSHTYAFPTIDPDIYFTHVPYHSTQVDLAGLFGEIPSTAQVTKFNPDQSACSWTGPFSCNAPITSCGQCLLVSVTAAPTNWVPSHY